MVMTDPLGDMFSRIRNAHLRRKSSVCSPASRLRRCVLDVLKREGYIRGFDEREIRKGVCEFLIELKYHEEAPVIQRLERISKPGRRVYSGIRSLPRVCNGLGVAILSTPRGVLSDEEARRANVGGEILCTVL